MPGMDGTGPAGQGPMTGRRLGPCGSNGTGAPQGDLTQSNWLSRLLAAATVILGAYGMRQNGGGGAGRSMGQGRGKRRRF